MYLKEVYRHSKRLFVGILFFIALQLAINYKAGMVFAPFFHYGMYSWVQEPQRDYYVNLVLINGDTLKGGDFSPQKWDKIHYTLDALYQTRCQEDFYNQQIVRLYAKAGFSRPDASHFIVQDSVQSLMQQYRNWLPGQLDLPGATVEIHRHRYRYHFGRLIFQQSDSSLIESNAPCP